ncbi:MAG: hypothetical protein LBG60_13260 [Bifidobacteriaceae bacterium]|nr:hypothetical protein [Bifidobacteriaceae bacterium]
MGDIIGRDEDVERLWRTLEHTSIRLNEVRRCGKSTALRLMKQRSPLGWLCVMTQVQDASSADALVELILGELMLHAGLPEKVKNVIRQFAKTFKSVAVKDTGIELADDFKTQPWRVLRQVMASVNAELEKDAKRLAIIVDEFPDALRAIAQRNPEAAAQVLALFRSARDNESGSRVRWVLTGSIGFHHVTRTLPGHGEGMTDLVVEALPPLAPLWARHLARCFLIGVGIETKADEPAVALLAERSDGIPFVLLMLVNQLHRSHTGLPASAAEADALLLAAATNPMWDDALTPLLAKVDDYYGQIASHAYSVLDAVAAAPMSRGDIAEHLARAGLALADNGLRDLLRLLRDDHYLIRDDADGSVSARVYRWRYPSLRDIWVARQEAEA